MTRKEFLLMTAAVCTGCQAVNQGSGTSPSTQSGGWVDAGPASRYAADGVYSDFASQGFFVVREGGKLMAIGSICTHRKHNLEAQPDHSFYCPAHGSTFDHLGKVREGPAKRDLPTLPTKTNHEGHLMVMV